MQNADPDHFKMSFIFFFQNMCRSASGQRNTTINGLPRTCHAKVMTRKGFTQSDEILCF